MAIRPVDLQLAYMATPQNAALVSAAEDAPAAAAAAQAAAFASQVTKREEQIGETQQAKGGKVNARGKRDAAEERPHKRKFLPNPDGREDDGAAADPLGLAGDGHHFIDVTA